MVTLNGHQTLKSRRPAGKRGFLVNGADSSYRDKLRKHRASLFIYLYISLSNLIVVPCIGAALKKMHLVLSCNIVVTNCSALNVIIILSYFPLWIQYAPKIYHAFLKLLPFCHHKGNEKAQKSICVQGNGSTKASRLAELSRQLHPHERRIFNWR